MGHRPGSWWLARSYNPSAIYNCDSKRFTGLKNRWTTPQLASWHGCRMAHVLRKAPLSNKSYRFCYRFGHSTCLEFWRFHVASLDVSVCSGAACTSKYSLSSLSLYKHSLSSLSEPQFVQLQARKPQSTRSNSSSNSSSSSKFSRSSSSSSRKP